MSFLCIPLVVAVTVCNDILNCVFQELVQLKGDLEQVIQLTEELISANSATALQVSEITPEGLTGPLRPPKLCPTLQLYCTPECTVLHCYL